MGENKYQKGQIYKIVSPDFSKCYIGSTCEALPKRMARHRYKYQQYLKGKENKYSSFLLFEEFGVENCKIFWIENWPCSSKKELEAREGHHHENTECVNKSKAGRSKKKWAEANGEKVRGYKNKYLNNNRDKHNQSVREYQKRNPEENARRIREWQSQKMECECGATHTKGNKAKHEKSKKHQEWLKQQDIQ
eukprot:Skav223733  [mRNA]  locus=scaffold424:59346:59921:+ [translate_table: standard]